LLESLLPVLQFIHERQIIHRDIKPENIMLRRADRQFVLIDFGVARVLSQTALIGGATVIGTPGFMAPEQMRGKVLPASDLYSLGATCLNLLTNIDPDELFDVVNERWRWRDRLPPQTQLRPEVVGVINQLVAPSLRQRAQSAIVMLRQLGVAAHPSSRSPTASPAASFASVNPSEVDENQPTAIGGTNDPANDPSLKKTAISDQPTVVSGTAAEQPAPLSSQPEREAGPAIQIDYTGLKTALMRKRWRSADDATRDILCQLCGKASGGYLFPNDLAQLPCADLRAIDFLWRKYSEDHFGLAIQMQIYQAAQADYAQFCAQVGWPMHNPNNHNYLRYQLKAPPGHLPSRKWMGGSQGWKQAEQFDKKLAACLR
ncbi:MAG: GUN4 domain-containing protein, partial [Spirulinaceae cyanobacterium]